MLLSPTALRFPAGEGSVVLYESIATQGISQP